MSLKQDLLKKMRTEFGKQGNKGLPDLGDYGKELSSHFF